MPVLLDMGIVELNKQPAILRINAVVGGMFLKTGKNSDSVGKSIDFRPIFACLWENPVKKLPC